MPAKPAPVTINPRWDDVWPIAHPNHHGEPPTGKVVGFGDLPAGREKTAIGELVSVTSNCPTSRPQPSWSSRVGARLLLGLAAGLVAFVALAYLHGSVAASILDRPDYAKDLWVLRVLRGVLWGGTGLAAVATFVLSGLVLKNIPVGPTYTCRLLGTEGFSEHVRTPTEDRATIVPFADVVVRSTSVKETTVLKIRGTTTRTTQHTVGSDWVLDGSRTVYRYFWRGHNGAEPPECSFVWAAERAQRRHRAAAMLPLLEGPGLRFVLTGKETLTLRREQIDVSFGGRQFSVAPAQVRRASAYGGNITFTFEDGTLTFPVDQLADWPLLMSALERLGIAS